MKASSLSFASISGVKTNAKLISTIQELLDYIQYMEDKWDTSNLWFRGLSRSSYGLIPSIYRKSVWKYTTDDANEVYGEFIRRGRAFIRTQSEYSKWEWYHLMQHYGVPTRLLDWTEGALIALFFAVRRLDSVDVPCVWVVDPNWLNSVTSGHDVLYYTDPTYQEKVDKKVLRRYEDDTNLPDYPIAVLPPYIDNRIIAQKSVYTIHGKKEDGYLELCRHKKNPKIIKLRIDTKKSRVDP
jgi:hypothetical protein